MAIRFTLRQLEYFVAVGESGSVTLASERLNVSPPSVSAAISQLETEFGLQLFIRKHAHGLLLTTGGRRFLIDAKKLLVSADNLRTLASEILETVSGPLGIGCFKTIAPIILPELRRRFEDRFPQVEIRQMEGDHLRLLEAIQNSEVDICLAYDLDIPNYVNFEPLVELYPYVMLASSHPLAGHSSLTPEHLASVPMVLLDLPSSKEYFLSVFQTSGLKPTIAERTSDMALLRSMVANGFGYTLANIRSRGEVAPDGKPLKFVPFESDLRPMRLGLLTRKLTHKPRVVAAFEDYCRDLANDTGIPGLNLG